MPRKAKPQGAGSNWKPPADFEAVCVRSTYVEMQQQYRVGTAAITYALRALPPEVQAVRKAWVDERMRAVQDARARKAGQNRRNRLAAKVKADDVIDRFAARFAEVAPKYGWFLLPYRNASQGDAR